MQLLYNLSIYLYLMTIRFAALFNKKAAFWVNGRNGIWKKLEKSLKGKKKIAWFHAASLGEFEQGRPVIEAFKSKYTDYSILLTFFSPSGYEIRKNYTGVDSVFYLPMDTPGNAKQFISIVQPKIVVFIKYEFWFNYISLLHKNKIPVYIISAIFRPNQHFFKWYGGWFRKQLRSFEGFFVQDERSVKLLRSIGIDQVYQSGDTRFDRVAEIARQRKAFPLIEKFSKNHQVMLAGSTWPPDEKLIASFFQNSNPGIKLIIAPHEIGDERIQSLLLLFANYHPILFSEANEQSILDTNVLIVDGMGFLSSLYQYCHVAYIGGGFGKGIHNILEAVTFGKPVIFGPNYQKFAEARDLAGKGGAFPIDENNFTETILKLFNDPILYKKSSKSCLNYIDEKKGATSSIMKQIQVNQ